MEKETKNATHRIDRHINQYYFVMVTLSPCQIVTPLQI
jgi:hypothetical protein